MSKYDMFIIFVFIIKIVYLLTAILNRYLIFKGNKSSQLAKTIQFWKDRLEFIFVASMSVILLYLFYPVRERVVINDYETNLLLFLFGFILLFTANWEMFLKDSVVLHLF